MSEVRGEIGVGVIGLGFMGSTHVRAYQAAQRDGFACPLVAVCDPDPDRRAGRTGEGGNIDTGASDTLLFDPEHVASYEYADELLADDRVQLVSICTHTDSHVDLAIRALRAGKHVLVEKPVATTAELAAPLLDAVRASDRVCMPAMCMRFWPAWAQIKRWIDDGSHGRVRSATFTRLGSRPAWSPDFYANALRSGGALVDLHIHDVDFACYCFGPPSRVSAHGTLDHVVSALGYDDGPDPISCEGGWDQDPAFPFTMRCVVNFEHATADFDIAREHQLVLSRDGEGRPVELPDLTGYDTQTRHLLSVIRGEERANATIGDAVEVLRVLDGERRSIESSAPVGLANHER